MKLKSRPVILFSIFFSTCFISCNQQAKTDKSETDTTTVDIAPPKTDTGSMPAYDAAMDPVNVEAKFLKLLHDTLNIKFYEVTLKPGDSVGLHTHPDGLLYVLEGGSLAIKVRDGPEQKLEFKKGMGFVSGPVTHSGKNVGSTTIKLLAADIYRPRN